MFWKHRHLRRVPGEQPGPWLHYPRPPHSPSWPHSEKHEERSSHMTPQQFSDLEDDFRPRQQGWFQSNLCFLWAASLGGCSPLPMPHPHFLGQHQITNQDRPSSPLLMYTCHLSSYSTERERGLLETLVWLLLADASKSKLKGNFHLSYFLSVRIGEMFGWLQGGLCHLNPQLLSFRKPQTKLGKYFVPSCFSQL